MLGLLIVLLGGCGSPVPPEQPSPPPEPVMAFSQSVVEAVDVDLAIVVAGELQQRPEQHSAVLQAHDLTSEGWETMLVAIASDPQASQRYATALEAGSEAGSEAVTEPPAGEE